jgi:hypothetical protein
LVPEPELADEIIETLSLGAMLLSPFLLDEDLATDDVSLLLAEIHAGDPTGGDAVALGGVGKWACGRERHKGTPVFASEGTSHHVVFG